MSLEGFIFDNVVTVLVLFRSGLVIWAGLLFRRMVFSILSEGIMRLWNNFPLDESARWRR